MNDAPDAEREPSPYLRLPLPVVALGLLVLIGGLFAFGLYANQNLRPGSVVAPTLVVAQPAPTAPGVPLAAATVAVTPVPTATAVVAASTATPAVTPLVLTAATGTPMAQQVASEPPTATAAVAAAIGSLTPLPTVEPTLAAEVGQAYVNYWRVRSKSLLDLDPTHLPDVMDGDYLQSFETNLDGLRASGRAIKTQVTLNYRVIQAGFETATVIDRIEDDSFYVAPGTEDPLSEPANDVLSLEVKLRNFEGSWKVVESVSAD